MSSIYSSAEQSLLPGGASGMSLGFVAIILIQSSKQNPSCVNHVMAVSWHLGRLRMQ